jgi:hypothetical protein
MTAPLPLCKAPHPTERDYSCGRFDGHAGRHKSYTFSIINPDEWGDNALAADQSEALVVDGVELPVHVAAPVELDDPPF